MRGPRVLASPIFWVALLFAALLLRMEALRPVFHWAFPGVEPVVYDRASFLELFLAHLRLVATASLAAAIVGLSLAVFVTRPAGRDFRTMVDLLAGVGQTFPPVAVLAIAVPLIGFGGWPTVVALFLYGLLPIIENAIAGLEGVLILAGIRVSVTIAIGTATIGSTVGALTLGTPIFDGLVANKLPFVIEGAVLVALFAILTDMLFARLDRRLRRRSGNRVD
jgi:osmoprotectant transport system permease protein